MEYQQNFRTILLKLLQYSALETWVTPSRMTIVDSDRCHGVLSLWTKVPIHLGRKAEEKMGPPIGSTGQAAMALG